MELSIDQYQLMIKPKDHKLIVIMNTGILTCCSEANYVECATGKNMYNLCYTPVCNLLVFKVSQLTNYFTLVISQGTSGGHLYYVSSLPCK